MRKYILTLCIFTLVIALTLAALLIISSSVKELPSQSVLPSDLAETTYVLSSPEYSKEGLSYTLFNSGYDRLALGIPNSNLFTVRINGQTVYSIDGQGGYTRAHLVEFEAMDIVKILYSELSAGPMQLLSVANPQIILGNPELIAGEMYSSAFINAVIMGLYAMLCFCCTVMFLGKRSETYLLFLVAGTAVMLMTLACTTGVLKLSYGVFRTLRSLLHTLPVVMSVYIALNLFKEQLPCFLKRFVSPPALALELAMAMALQLGAPTIQYYLVRFVLWMPMLAALPVGSLKRDRNILLVLTAFAVSEGLSLFPYAFKNAPLPATVMFTRLSDIGNLLFVAACMIVIVGRFCAKFTESESLSAQLAEINSELESIVASRTLELKNKQAHKHGLMINIFHDLRSPLFAIRGRLDTFKPLDEEQREFLAVTNSRLSYVERLTEDLFLLAKLESNDLIFDETDVELGNLVIGVCASAESTAAAKGLHLSCECSGECTVWGDGYRLQQAIVNLLDNAILYTPDGGEIRVSLEGGDPIVLKIRDNGNGIPPNKLEHIFERYYVVETRNNRRSSGLGLAIAHKLIAAHNGTLTAESTLGEGTCFTVKLPVV